MRRSRLCSIIMILIMIAGSFISTSRVAYAADMEGSGTSQSPYLIKTLDDLFNISSNPSSHYKIVNDLNFNNVKRVPIRSFTGVLDGAGHTVKNLNILGDSSSDNTGIFATANGAVIKDLKLDNITVTAEGNNVGILAGIATNCTIEVQVINSQATTAKDYLGVIGYMTGGTVKNTSVKNITLNGKRCIGAVAGIAEGAKLIDNQAETVNITGTSSIGSIAGTSTESSFTNCSGKDINLSGTEGVGGICGSAIKSVYLDCHAVNGTIEANIRAGGLVGYITGSSKLSTLTRCYSTIKVTGQSGSIGGLVGGVSVTSVQIFQSFAKNVLKGTTEMGGLVGRLDINTNLHMENSYSLSNITCTDDNSNAGGLVGGTYVPTAKNSYAACKINAKTIYGLMPGLTNSNSTSSYFDQEAEGVAAPISHARTTEEMFAKVTYSNWDFDSIWSISDGKDYPKLRFAGSVETPDPTSKKLKVILEIKEELQLSVDEELSENGKVRWSTSNAAIVSVDSEGMLKANTAGDAIVTVSDEDGKYLESIRVLVLKDASAYRLAIDLKTSKTVRLTIDDDTNEVPVEWSSHDPSIVTVSNLGKVEAVSKGLALIAAKGSEDNEIGHVYVRVR